MLIPDTSLTVTLMTIHDYYLLAQEIEYFMMIQIEKNVVSILFDFMVFMALSNFNCIDFIYNAALRRLEGERVQNI